MSRVSNKPNLLNDHHPLIRAENPFVPPSTGVSEPQEKIQHVRFPTTKLSSQTANFKLHPVNAT